MSGGEVPSVLTIEVLVVFEGLAVVAEGGPLPAVGFVVTASEDFLVSLVFRLIFVEVAIGVCVPPVGVFFPPREGDALCESGIGRVDLVFGFLGEEGECSLLGACFEALCLSAV